jgi:hypothetical protein
MPKAKKKVLNEKEELVMDQADALDWCHENEATLRFTGIDVKVSVRDAQVTESNLAPAVRVIQKARNRKRQ